MRKYIVIAFFVLLCSGFLFFRSQSSCQAFGSLCTSLETEAVSEIAPQYLWYTQQNVEAALQHKQKVVLFFFAPWCGTCSTLDMELREHPERLDAGITVLKVAYDTDSYLKRKYGVVTQHTLVFINQDQSVRKIWIGGGIDTLNAAVR